MLNGTLGTPFRCVDINITYGIHVKVWGGKTCVLIKRCVHSIAVHMIWCMGLRMVAYEENPRNKTK